MGKVNLENAVEYVPEYDNNMEADEPWSITFVPMTAGDNRSYLAALTSGGGKDSLTKALNVLKRVFSERVVEVKGLVDIHGVPILTGADFYERSEQEIIDEIYSAMTKASQLRKGLKND